MNFDGTEQKLVTTNLDFNDVSPCDSPDESHIAFFSDRTGRDEIWLKDIQHNEYHQLTGNEKGYPKGRFVWAKDSTKIYYTGYYNEEYGVFTIDLEL